MTHHFSDFAEVVFNRAARLPEDLAYRFHSPQRAGTVDLAMGDLARRISAIAAGLQRRNLAGERVVLALPHSPDFIVAFFGCLAAGAVAVPVPHQRAGRDDARFNAVLENAKPGLVLVDAAAIQWVRQGVADRATAGDQTAALVARLDEIEEDGAHFVRPALGADTLAVLQYTSGSTGEPKGVMITHGNMLANCQLIQDTLQVDSTSAGALWLPFYHDMGLVGAVLLPMYCNGCVDLMSPQDFLRAPISWLEKLSRVKATTTAAPNFALELCCDMATPANIAGLDLSALRCLLTGSEPVNPNTIERFAEVFAPTGFKYDAFLPAYGLAEATLLATGTLRHEHGATLCVLDTTSLTAGKVRIADRAENAQRLVGNGAPDGRARIADPVTCRPLGEGEIGEIWLTGPSIAKGYWGRAELTQTAFGALLVGEPEVGPFYRTGDLGFVLGDDLFITGRLKDLIIVRGRNIYPQDVEEVATRTQPLLWTGAAAAFGTDCGKGEEVVLVAEAALDSVGALRQEQAATGLITDMLKRISDAFDVTPAEICIIRPGRLPRTSSGKIQRGAARADWEQTGFSTGLLHRWTAHVTRPAEQPQTADLGPFNRPQIEAWLLERLAHNSGQPNHLIDLDEPFSSYGLDSVKAIEMIEAINRLDIGGRTVDPADLYDHPTIARLLDHMFADEANGRADETARETQDELEREAAALKMLLGD